MFLKGRLHEKKFFLDFWTAINSLDHISDYNIIICSIFEIFAAEATRFCAHFKVCACCILLRLNVGVVFMTSPQGRLAPST